MRGNDTSTTVKAVSWPFLGTVGIGALDFAMTGSVREGGVAAVLGGAKRAE